MNLELLKQALARYPNPDIKFTYGTAGFRTTANTLPCVLFRVGLLAVLRSKKLDGKAVGCMITASHNPVHDNGAKLVEPLGEMLVQSWESYATNLANASNDLTAFMAVFNEIVKTENISLSNPSNVIIARDTRPSGPTLVQACISGIQCLSSSLTDCGILTTPQLHYMVRCINTLSTPTPYGIPTEQAYYQKLAKAYTSIVAGKPKLSTMHVDAANGVGAKALLKLAEVIGEGLSVVVCNANIEDGDLLNNNCGADYVKLKQDKPRGMEIIPGMRCASLDGDADRIVFYFVDKEKKFRLLDGDRIATLAAGYLSKLVKEADIKVGGKAPKVGIVQTAYANGSSTEYARKTLNVPVVFTMTGVKHLHHAAEEFDIGVYFEANGHGTVLFSREIIKEFYNVDGKTKQQVGARKLLQAFSDLINQAVGDALSDFLLVEAILTLGQISFESWFTNYTDLPNIQQKIKVSNRHIFKPIKADTELAEPTGLQPLINEQVSKFKKGRAFVRPSGTEDIVRVYAEAETRKETDELANRICGIVFDKFGGIGERPKEFL